MTPTEVAAKLQHFNDWRRGGDIDQPGPLAVGEAIDAAIEMIERLEAAESEAIEQARLNGMGAERELALMAKLEVAEKERDAAELMSLALRAKITEMEKQAPVGEIVAFGESLHEVSWNRGKLPPLGAKIYALPGAKGEGK